GGPDEDGCWTGSAALDDDGIPAVLYTGVHPQAQCLARSHDGLHTWDKHPGNPVVAEPPEGIDPRRFRDPCFWREDDGWYMIIGAGVEGVGGRALLYRSPELVEWEYLHPLCEGAVGVSGDMWECPDFFPLSGRHVLLVSAQGEQLYMVGDYDARAHRFEPERSGRIGGGVCYYAGKSFADGSGRRILWGWLRERRSREAQIAAGWSGAMSLPQVLSIGADGSLGIEPAPEVEALRGEGMSETDVRLAGGEEVRLDEASGDALELLVEADAAGADRLRVSVRCTPDGAERSDVVWDQARGQVTLDLTGSSLSGDVERGVFTRPLELADGEPVQLRVFVDRSAIEVYANGRECLVGRAYPTRRDATGVRFGCQGGSVKLTRLCVWQMKCIW
ncbi:MAG TPA: glycoside hydrolase family 32 protein, partial [Armatimonadota bacterium]|nr:glycoside hydrolase family 32 protein [Armatimonadota bacterium]